MARTEDDSIEISSLIINNGTSGPYAPPSSFPNKVKRPQSPFFRPSTPQRIIVTETISTPNGTRTITIQKKRLVSSGRIDEENKSSIIGAFSNLVNAIVGAGIIGIPYAMKECGLGAGLVLIFFVALLTDKSLRLLIETGKHAQVQSYETLMEAAFGRKGFIFISINMLIMSYGAMVAYLLVIKDTVPFALGIDPDDEGMKRAILLISSISILLPLSCQRDIADLSKTSSISVMFDILLVGIIVISSPIRSAVEASGGLKQVLLQSIVHKSTLFVGLGVLSFAFVCQDSSFIIAGSLRHPTKKRWSIVTKSTLLTSSFLSTFIGCAGYLGFQEETEGNILNSFIDYPPSGKIFGMVDASSTVNIARGLLGLTMFFVYPMSSYVARHVMIVLLFSGRQAHEGNDHTVLARSDRRITLTFVLYLFAILPALLFKDIGVVLAATGAVGGSSLSYLGPGMVYLGIYGNMFLEMASRLWCTEAKWNRWMWRYPPSEGESLHQRNNGIIVLVLWYITLMPLWCLIADVGRSNFLQHEIELSRKSPCVVNRLGKTASKHKTQSNSSVTKTRLIDQKSGKRSASFDDMLESNRGSHIDRNEVYPLLQKSLLIPPSSQASMTPSKYGSLTKYPSTTTSEGEVANDDLSVEDDPLEISESDPTWLDFSLAIVYIILGSVALSAGLFSIAMK